MLTRLQHVGYLLLDGCSLSPTILKHQSFAGKFDFTMAGVARGRCPWWSKLV